MAIHVIRYEYIRIYFDAEDYTRAHDNIIDRYKKRGFKVEHEEWTNKGSECEVMLSKEKQMKGTK